MYSQLCFIVSIEAEMRVHISTPFSFCACAVQSGWVQDFTISRGRGVGVLGGGQMEVVVLERRLYDVPDYPPHPPLPPALPKFTPSPPYIPLAALQPRG